VRPSIGQALSSDTSGQILSAHGVIDAQRNAVVVAEIELGQVASYNDHYFGRTKPPIWGARGLRIQEALEWAGVRFTEEDGANYGVRLEKKPQRR
jgi:hypothetical protein